MERSQAPKILRLAPDSMLVPSLCPFSAYASSVLFPFLSFIPLGLQGSPCASLVHYRGASCTIYTWGLLSQKLKLFIWASCPTHVLYFRMYLFPHYMHRYDLSFGQAGLPGSCAYALCSR